MFRLTASEKAELVANHDILSKVKYSRTLPNAFTEQGASMAANVLSSRRAIEMSVFVVRAFVRIRQQALQHTKLARRLDELERPVGTLVAAIRRLMSAEAVPPQRRIGFVVGKR